MSERRHTSLGRTVRRPAGPVGLGAAAPAWTPADLDPAVLAGWFNPRASAGVGGAADAGLISTFTDASATADHLTAAGGARPVYRTARHGGRPRVAGGSSRHMLSGAAGRVFTHALMVARYRAYTQTRGVAAPTAFTGTVPGLLSINGFNGGFTEKSIILTALGGGSAWSDYYSPTYRRDGAVDATMVAGLERTTHLYEMIQPAPGFSDDWALALFDDRGRGEYLDADAMEIVLLNQPSADDLANVRSYLGWWQTGTVVCWTGDSLHAGYGASTAALPAALMDADWYGTVDVPNIAVPGQGVIHSNSGVSDTLATTDKAKLDPLLAGRGTAILVVLCGTNDIANTEGSAAILAGLWDYCDDRRAEGWLVVVGTLLDRGDLAGDQTTFNATRAAVNAGIVADWADHADGLADYAANAHLGTVGASANATYFLGDTVHLTDTGQGLLRTISQSVIEGLMP